jgi:hypothetical protein
VDAITDGTGADAPRVAAYVYLGLDTIVNTSHSQVAGASKTGQV